MTPDNSICRKPCKNGIYCDFCNEDEMGVKLDYHTEELAEINLLDDNFENDREERLSLSDGEDEEFDKDDEESDRDDEEFYQEDDVKFDQEDDVESDQEDDEESDQEDDEESDQDEESDDYDDDEEDYENKEGEKCDERMEELIQPILQEIFKSNRFGEQFLKSPKK